MQLRCFALLYCDIKTNVIESTIGGSINLFRILYSVDSIIYKNDNILLNCRLLQVRSRLKQTLFINWFGT